MYHKTQWVKETINNSDEEYHYWIDAGLSHNSLFPPHLAGDLSGDSYCDQYFNFSVFNERLVDKINTTAGDKMYCICFDQSVKKWQSSMSDKYTSGAPLGGFHMIGGLFGGKRHVVLEFCRLFEDKLNMILNDGLLFNEEQIYTAVVNDQPDMFSQQLFNSWYYEGGDLYDQWTQDLDIVDEFYKLFV